ncbi:ABC transporter permease [Micromonospora echinospora]|uniref:ABC transporter permease n=1 Tax=Micromonospora echinospora TaxID=1877 RepID=UPI0037B78E91
MSRAAAPVRPDDRAGSPGPEREWLWVLFSSLRLQTRLMRGSPFALLLGVVQPVVLLAVTVGANDQLTAEATTRFTVGVVMMAFWGATIWTAGGILQFEVHAGTLRANVTSTRSPQVILLGKCLGASLYTLPMIVVTTIVTVLLLGAPLRAERPGLLLLGLLLVAVSGTGLGMLLSCLFLLTRHGNHWSSALMYPIYILGGFMIPIDLLPEGVRWISTVVSLRWATDFLTAAAAGRFAAGSLAVMVALTVGYFALGWYALRQIIRRAKREALLDRR